MTVRAKIHADTEVADQTHPQLDIKGMWLEPNCKGTNQTTFYNANNRIANQPNHCLESN